ncbi:MAG TPA: methyl-accepting chemotaxis protein [Pyrinomonadaceae bacterium]|nr:methyl-accepting chemotaxis protein [Pyrinomonadaceae bacterium]HMP66412.1 methyl-accepting chemotaxis protein [Pyrinomonadaceae bacterium]
MQTDRKDPLFASLRSRVWLSTVALAAVNCVCGVGTYLAVSYVFTDATVPVAAAFAVTLALTVAYGRWLSDDLMRPIDKVNLAARSLERNADAPLPSTTGSAETDELLTSLHRNAKQLSNILMLMESVAAGKTASASVPLENADRLSSTFQKLVAKVTDSIDAKNELEELRTSVTRLATDIEHAVRVNAPVEIRPGSEKTAEIAAAFNTLQQRSDSSASRLRAAISHMNTTLATVRDRVGNLREVELPAAESLNKLIEKLKHTPDRIGQLKEEALAMPTVSGDLLGTGNDPREMQILTRKLNGVRAYTSDLQRRLRNVRERTHQLPQVLRLAEDLSRRSKMVALNASIHAGSAGNNGTSAITDEFSLLSERAVRLQRDLTGIDKAIADDISEAEPIVENILTEITEALLNATAAAELMSKLEPVIDAVAGLPARISSFSEADAREREDVMRQLTALHFERNRTAKDLNEADHLLASICNSIKELQTAEPTERPYPSDSAAVMSQDPSDEPDEYSGPAADTAESPMLELPGEN